MKTLLMRTLDQWRAWLTENHATVSEVWLILYKGEARGASIGIQDARDEALCFGWVDSLVKRLDDRRYALKLTPRRPDSRWSAVNRKRYAALEAAGRLKAPGIERPPTDRGYGPRPTRLPAGEASGLHPDGDGEASEGPAPLRGVELRATPAVCRLDRVREARGHEAEAPEGGDSLPDRRPGVGTEVTDNLTRTRSRPIMSESVGVQSGSRNVVRR